MAYYSLAPLVLLAALASVESCVYLYGSRYDTGASTGHYSYAYVGLDWPEEFPTCSGTHQSPIHVPGHTGLRRLTEFEASKFGYGQLPSNGSNINIKNNGHTVVVNLPSTYKPDASVVYRGDAATAVLASKFSNTSTGQQLRVSILPAQFHFHTRSEHLVNGKEYPLEMHIVNYVYNDTLKACGDKGCITVVGILFKLDESDEAEGNSFVKTVFSAMPQNEGATAYLPSGATLDFDKVLPADHSYVTYEGSLTTPPCTWSSSVLWHLLTTPVKISKEQLHQFQLAVGETQCQDTTPAALSAASGPSSPARARVAALKEAAVTSRGDAGNTTTTTTTEFEVPAWAEDSVDHQMCHKITGQNYREVQDLKDRPIWFYPAQGACDTQLQALAGSNKVVSDLLYPSKDNIVMTLEQYHNLVEANMTTDAKCAGLTSGAGAVQFTASLFVQWVVGAAVMALLVRN